MWPYFTQAFGNPHSVHHAYGQEAEQAVEAARAEVAQLIGAEPREIVFTSGATESNNTAIKGAARFHGADHGTGGKRHVVTLATEHKCVLESAKALEKDGFDLIEEGLLRVYLKYDADGEPVIRNLERVSRPGLRKYVGADDLPRVMNGLGVAIVATSRGIMTDKEARRIHVGGEVLAYVY